MKNLLFLLFSLTVITGSAQEYMTFHFYPPTDSVSYDGAFSVKYENYSSALTYSIHASHIGFGYDTIAYTDSLSGIPGFATIEAYAMNSFGDTVGSCMKLINPQESINSYIQFNQIQQSLTNNSCDGHAIIDHYFDTTLYSSASVNYLLSRHASHGGPMLDSIPVTSLNFNNLCPGFYMVHSVNNLLVVGTTFVIDAISNTPPTFDVDVYSTTETVDSCNSTAFASVLGGQSPFQYSWDGGVFSTTDSIENLCSGLHLVTVIDANNDTSSANFGVTNSSNSYSNNNNYGTVVDTFAFDTQDCSFDYSQPVDSMFITNTIVIDSNSMSFEFEIWQSGSATNYIDTISYVYGMTGTGLVSLTFYCEVKANGPGHFINFTDYVMLGVTTSLEISESFSNEISIYPNPVSDILHINAEGGIIVEIIDLRGKLIFQTSETKINVSALQSGVYFVSIKDVKGYQIFTEKLIIK